MSKYYVDFTKTATMIIEANSSDEAEEIAQNNLSGDYEFDEMGDWMCENVSPLDG